MNLWAGDRDAITGDHDDGIGDGGANSCFGNRKDDHQAAFLAIFFESFGGEALAGFAPLKVFVGDALALLPARIENRGFEIGAAGGVGIALGGDVETTILRALDHGD